MQWFDSFRRRPGAAVRAAGVQVIGSPRGAAGMIRRRARAAIRTDARHQVGLARDGGRHVVGKSKGRVTGTRGRKSLDHNVAPGRESNPQHNDDGRGCGGPEPAADRTPVESQLTGATIKCGSARLNSPRHSPPPSRSPTLARSPIRGRSRVRAEFPPGPRTRQNRNRLQAARWNPAPQRGASTNRHRSGRPRSASRSAACVRTGARAPGMPIARVPDRAPDLSRTPARPGRSADTAEAARERP